MRWLRPAYCVLNFDTQPPAFAPELNRIKTHIRNSLILAPSHSFYTFYAFAHFFIAVSPAIFAIHFFVLKTMIESIAFCYAFINHIIQNTFIEKIFIVITLKPCGFAMGYITDLQCRRKYFQFLFYAILQKQCVFPTRLFCSTAKIAMKNNISKFNTVSSCGECNCAKFCG